MDKAVSRYFNEALASSTKKSYQAGQKRYLDFCKMYNVSDPFPVKEAILCYFVAFLGEQGLMAATVKSYLSSVRQLQISLGLPEVALASMPQLKQIIKGVGVARGKEGKAPRKKRPITPAILGQLRTLKGETQLNGPDWEMFWGASCLAFFGFLRMGEILAPSVGSFNHLNLAAVGLSANHRSKPSVIHVRIKVSKTDPFCQGTTVVLGRTRRDLCPVSALIGYLKIRGKSPGPLFCHREGHPLSKPVFVRWVKQALGRLGYDEKGFAGHSFRVGAATTAASVGIQDSTIKALGRWESTAYLLYIRLRPEELQEVATRLIA